VTDRLSPLAQRAALAAVAGSFLFLVAVWIAMPWVAGDTPFVLDGTNAFLTCLSHHDYNACGYTGKLNYWGLTSPIGDWPLLQHVPDLISVGLGADGHAARTRILELLGVAAIVGSVVAAWLALARAGLKAWFWAFMLVVLSSPYLWYSRTTFGEALAAGFLVALVAAAVFPAHPAVLGLAALAASWTKETSYPFVAALCALGLVLAKRRTGRAIGSRVVGASAGIAVAIITTSLFNVVRYGSAVSPNFTEPQLHTLGIGHKVEYTAAVIASPNGGVLTFWPVAAVLVLAACLLAFTGRAPRVGVVPGLVLAVVILVLSVGFASWWTPLGWFAYGPRLALPWVLPVVLIALVAYGDALAGPVRRLLRSTWRVVSVFAVVLLLTLPHVGQTWRPNQIGRFFSLPSMLCDAPWRGSRATWNECQHQLMWLDRPMELYALRGVATPGGAATSAVVALGLLASLILLRDGLRTPRTAAEENGRQRKRVADARAPATLERSATS
jgi:hypothetical protein